LVDPELSKLSPLGPQRRGLFYGWWVIAACVVGLALSWPVIALYNFGPFVIPLASEFGWNRGEISGAITVVSWTATLMSLGLGFIVDRFGVRRVMKERGIFFGRRIQNKVNIQIEILKHRALPAPVFAYLLFRFPVENFVEPEIY